ncbi:exocyst complex component Sec5-domain-containing protein [Melampsora americana]|nr:exocyst complex component Sec5-domain-containing protein [Melampsora americana]
MKPYQRCYTSNIGASVSTTSKTFSPKAFLSKVHPNASFSDLKMGGERLRESLEQRSEALKILVESEFDRFVAVKAATETVYEQMKNGPLRPEEDYSIGPLRESLKSATSKAEQVYTPILENRRKAERLRSTLGVFERSKFFFNLPGTLIEAIEAEKYDTALLAYKRGRNMLDSRPGQVLNLPAPSNSEDGAQHKRIFDKVWLEVEKVVNIFKLRLGEKLTSSSIPIGVEEIEKTIEILLELDPLDDPAWLYFEAHHRSIIEKLKQIFTRATQKVRDILAELNLARAKEEQSAIDIRTCLAILDLPPSVEAEAILGQASGSQGWKALLEFIRVPSELLSREIIPYWKIVKGYIDGKYQRVGAETCKQMTNEIITTYVNLLSQFFLFTSDPNSLLGKAAGSAVPEFLPRNTNSITAGYYLKKMIDSLVDWSNEVGSLELPEESLVCLKEMIGNARFRFEASLSVYWVRDSKIFHRLEDWSRPEKNDKEEYVAGTTIYLTRLYTFHRHLTQTAFRLAGATDAAANAIFTGSEEAQSPKKSKSENLPVDCAKKAQSAFLDALYGFLDGLVHVAFTPPKPLPSVDELSDAVAGIKFSSMLMKASKANQDDTRVLLTISNLSHLRTTYIPKLFRQFQAAFRVDMALDTATLMDVIGQLDALLLGDYIKRKSVILADIINTGVNQVDWFLAPKPTEVHAFVYDALLSLVLVHAQVSAIAGPPNPSSSVDQGGSSLVKTVLSGLIEELANQCLEAFGSVEKFGMGGMLQATLEIEFMHQTLTAYVTPEADQTLQSIYKKISVAYQRTPNLEGSNEVLQNELEALKRTLQSSRRTTALAFVCFKKPKAPSSGTVVPASLLSPPPVDSSQAG